MDYLLNTLRQLLAIPSPTGFTHKGIEFVKEQLNAMGFKPFINQKGCLFCTLGGNGKPLVYAAHLDTLGAMVSGIHSDGTLALSPLGGLSANNTECENFTVFTRLGEKQYTGTLQLADPSIHVNGNYNSTSRSFDTCRLYLDEEVSSAADVKALGISVGDIAAPDPRTVITPSGFVKSRFLDDKLSVAILLSLAHDIAQGKLQPTRKVSIYITVYEEVGHGCSSGIPSDTQDLISVDMGCVGSLCQCKETQVSICAKDSQGPYDYELTTQLIVCAEALHLDYAIDVYPHYGSDADAALHAGHEVRHGLIGSGVFASHGYERTHVKGITATLALVKGFIAGI